MSLQLVKLQGLQGAPLPLEQDLGGPLQAAETQKSTTPPATAQTFVQGEVQAAKVAHVVMEKGAGMLDATQGGLQTDNGTSTHNNAGPY